MTSKANLLSLPGWVEPKSRFAGEGVRRYRGVRLCISREFARGSIIVYIFSAGYPF